MPFAPGLRWWRRPRMHLCKLRFAAFELPKCTVAAVALVEGVVSRDSSRSSALSIRARTGLRCTETSTS